MYFAHTEKNIRSFGAEERSNIVHYEKFADTIFFATAKKMG